MSSGGGQRIRTSSAEAPDLQSGTTLQLRRTPKLAEDGGIEPPRPVDGLRLATAHIPALSIFHGPPQRIRTFTEEILSLRPLPVGLEGDVFLSVELEFLL